MTQQWQGVFRSIALLSSWVAVCFLLATSAAFGQQQKRVLVPTTDVAAETNDRIVQLAAASSAEQGDYVIGGGDLLGVEVFDVPELSREVRVNATGYISLPLLPVKVRASGLTAFQLQDKIAELLQTNDLVLKPQVTVALREQHSQPITMVGSVRTPMVLQAIRQTTLLQALSQAGGIAPDAGNMVIVTRPPSSSQESGETDAEKISSEPQTFTISLNDLLESGDSRFNIVVLGGDVISVPRAGFIYVVGAVNHPGGFAMGSDRDRMTTLKILSLAGGTSSTAKVKEAIILRKNPGTGKRDEVPVDLNKVMHLKTEDVTLQDSDILFVPDSNGKKAMHRAGDMALALTAGAAMLSVGRL